MQRGDICAAIESVDGMYSLMLPLAVADQLGCEMEGYNASYMPSQMLGINRSGGQTGWRRSSSGLCWGLRCRTAT